MHDCLIAFGSNEGNSRSIFEQVSEIFASHPSIQLVAKSRPVLTRPVGGPGDQPPYLNAVFRARCSIGPQELHQFLREIETRFGRVRRQRWDARTIDLDLLLFSDQVFESDSLTVPHPRMSFRRFVLEPACEVASEMTHPVSRCQLKELLDLVKIDPGCFVFVCLQDRELELAQALEAKVASMTDSRWTMRYVCSSKQFEDAKRDANLVVYFQVESKPGNNETKADENLTSKKLALTFRGPTLVLPMDFQLASTEFSAAIQAMQPFEVSNGVE